MFAFLVLEQHEVISQNLVENLPQIEKVTHLAYLST
jgi:hypothetical protein